jgi:hypothetical protein
VIDIWRDQQKKILQRIGPFVCLTTTAVCHYVTVVPQKLSLEPSVYMYRKHTPFYEHLL